MREMLVELISGTERVMEDNSICS